ncbi:MAG: PKD domain-containing protein [Muribaculaceae bacterium]|nr:PKD domain-containing protein [Muribaculaceae bacterium]
MTLKRMLAMMLMLVSIVSWAQTGTWVHEWNVSKASGGEGFYHITDNDETTQTTTLKGLEWTYSGNTSVTAYTASAGQYFGSAKSPVKHATLTTSGLKGSKVLSVAIEAKTKDAAQEVAVGVSVNGVNYGDAQSLNTTRTAYTYEPAADAQDGDIVITMDQTSETVGIIYFYKMTITYDGPGPVKPEPKDAGLSYPLQTVEVECGDNAYANYLNNPNKLSPITYSCSDPELAAINSNGDIFTTGKKVGQATVTASFAGNDDFKAGSASYTLIVKEKPVIAAPTMTPAGGTFTEPVTVTITSDDPLCKAIWYSTTITDVDDLGYDDQTIIVPGNMATVTLDEDCTLLAVAVGDNNVGLPTTGEFKFNIALKADFTAAESSQAYYEMGWDTMDEASTWHYYGINDQTWTMAETPQLDNIKPFNTIDPKSNYSLTIFYANSKQRERAVSPEVEIKDNSTVEFYMAFSGVWLHAADLKFYVNDLTAGTQTQEFSAFKWAQDNEFTGPSWEQFSFDLAKYAGHKCTFEFIYEGTYGDNIAIDGFKVKNTASGEDAKITIFEGEQVHFKDMSLGHPTAWNWTAEGAETLTSTEQNPVMTFNKAGKYTVKLVASKGAETSEAVKAEYVVVSAAAPKAHIGLPEGAYYSPYAYAFVPTDVPMTFMDKSTGNPTSWKWKFEGTDVATSTEQNPTVTYTEAGKYGMELVVENAAGTDRDFLVEAIQAGGEQEVWNIAPEEIDQIGSVTLGWYGSYAGTNWLGMEAFGEKFCKPIATAYVSGVSAYFDNVTADDQDAEITVSICLPDAAGMPGQTVATASHKVSELAYSATDVLPTEFKFDETVVIDGEFFVVIEGFPNTGYNDNVNLLCVARGEGNRNTAYHLLTNDYSPMVKASTEGCTWYESIDEPVSMCLAPVMSYDDPSTGISNITVERKHTGIYDIMGRKLNAPVKGINIIDGKKVLVK